MKHGVRNKAGHMRLLTLFGVLALLVAACSGGTEASTTTAISDTGSETTAADTGSDTTEAADTGSDTTAAEDEGTAEGPHLFMAIGAEPGSMDQFLKSDGQRDVWSYSVLEGLTRRTNETGADGIAPLLAESWELDGTGFVFNLRQGVTFHDGSELTADDVVASYNRMLSPESELLNQFIADDTVVEKIDDYTVRVSRPVADPTIPAKASLIMIVPDDWADVADNRLAEAMVGTGPYQFDGWTKGEQIDLSRYDAYWGDAASIERVTIRFLPEESTRLAALQSDEIQLARNMSPDNVAVAPNVISGNVSEILILRLNTASGPLTDLRVRQAINHAIDRQAIIEAIYSGFAAPAKGQEVASYVFGANPDLSDYEYNLDLARSLIEEAGAAGQTVTMSATTGRWAKDREVAQAIAAMITEAGLTVDLQFPEFSLWVEDLFVAAEDDTKASDIAIYNHSNELFDSSKTVGQNLACNGGASTYCNERVDELAEQALGETDTAAREALYHEAWQIMYDEAAFAAVADVEQVHFTSEELNWEPSVDGFMRIQEMSIG